MERVTVRTLIVAFAYALLLAAFLVRGTSAEHEGGDVLTQVMGGTAHLAADMACSQAESYFHGGISGGCPDEHHAHVETNSNLPLAEFLKRLNGETAPKEHRHLEGEEEKELLPWFVAAVKLNPNHIQAWCSGSYWFYRTGDRAQAEDFITQGIRHNPKKYLVHLERGILYHRLKKWDRCITDLENAERLWRNDSEDAEFHLRAITTYLKDARKHLR